MSLHCHRHHHRSPFAVAAADATASARIELLPTAPATKGDSNRSTSTAIQPKEGLPWLVALLVFSEHGQDEMWWLLLILTLCSTVMTVIMVIMVLLINSGDSDCVLQIRTGSMSGCKVC